MPVDPSQAFSKAKIEPLSVPDELRQMFAERADARPDNAAEGDAPAITPPSRNRRERRRSGRQVVAFTADPMTVASDSNPPSADNGQAARTKLAERSVRGLGEWAAFPMNLEPGDHEVRLHLRDAAPGTLLRLVLEADGSDDEGEPIGTIELEGSAVGRRSWSLDSVRVHNGGKHTLRVEVLGPACEIERAEMLPLHRRPQTPAPTTSPATSPATPFAQRTNPFDPGDASVTYPDNLDTPAATTQHGDTVGWCVGGEWFEQAVDLRAGVYDLAVDAAAPATDVEIDVLLNGTVLGTLRLAETDGFADHRTNVLRNIPITTDTSGVLRFEIDGSACDVASVRMERAGAFDEELAAEAGVRKLLAERAASNGRHEVEAQRTDMLSVSDADFERLDHSDDPIVDVPTSPVEQNAQQGEAGDVNRDMAEALVAMADTLLPTEPPPAEQPTPVDDTTDEIDTLADAYGLELEEPAATDDATPPAEPTVEPPPVTDEPHAPTGLAQVAEVPDASRTVTVRRAEAGSGWTLGYVRGNDSDWYAGETKPMGARGGKWSALSASATPEALTAVAWPQVNASPVALWTNDGPTPVAVDIAGELTVDWHKTGNDRLAHPALRADVVVGVAAATGAVRPLFVATDLAKPTQTWQRESRRLDFAGHTAELMPGESVLVGLRVHGVDGQAFGVTLTDALVLEITPLST